MPDGNNLQHSNYTRTDPGDRVGYREVESAAPPDSVPWQDAMAGHGARLVEAGVRVVVFMHGTYLGTDLFGMQRLDEAGGLKRGYSRGISGLDALLAMMREDGNGMGTPPGEWKPPFPNEEPMLKSLDDKVGDAANFTSKTVSLFEKAINRDASQSLTCFRYLWSCEHHHLGRAKAAIQFIARLRNLVADRGLGRDDRILIQAHGHAGQVAALVSNLLAPVNSSARKVFLEILKASLDQTEADQLIRRNLESLEPLFGTADVLNGVSLDVVTLGTPIRYGWDPSVLGKLLHIVNHRMMRQDGKRWLAKMEMPQVTMEMPIAWGGTMSNKWAWPAATPRRPVPRREKPTRLCGKSWNLGMDSNDGSNAPASVCGARTTAPVCWLTTKTQPALPTPSTTFTATPPTPGWIICCLIRNRL